MTAEELVTTAKKWLWETSDVANDEYKQTIEACALDLQNAGVKTPDLSDPLIQQAVKLYLKAQLGYDEQAERFGDAYEHLKHALSISYKYREASNDSPDNSAEDSSTEDDEEGSE